MWLLVAHEWIFLLFQQNLPFQVRQGSCPEIHLSAFQLQTLWLHGFSNPKTKKRKLHPSKWTWHSSLNKELVFVTIRIKHCLICYPYFSVWALGILIALNCILQHKWKKIETILLFTGSAYSDTVGSCGYWRGPSPIEGSGSFLNGFKNIPGKVCIKRVHNNDAFENIGN